MHALRLSILAYCLLISAPSVAANEAKLDAVQTELKAQQVKAKELSKQEIRLTRELGTLEQKRDALVQDIRTEQARIQSNRAEMKRLERLSQAKKLQLHDQRAQIARLLHGMIRLQRMPQHVVAAKPTDMHTMLQTASAIDVTYGATHTLFAQVNHEFEELAGLMKQLQTSQSSLNTKLANIRDQQAELASMLKERRQLQRRLHKDATKAAQRVQELSEQSGSLQELIAKLETETLLFEAIGTPHAKPAITRKKSAREKVAFTARRGNLTYPASGRIQHRFGDKRGVDDRYRGMELRTAKGAPVTAPHGGKVVFSGDFMDYGPMVIIEHDKTYHSVIAGLDVVAVEPGEPITRGTLVGTMSASTDPTLYYELRKNSKAIDPSAWMGNLALASNVNRR